METLIERQEAAGEVLSVHRKFARKAARALEGLVAPVLEDGQPMPDFVSTQGLLAAALEARWRRLSRAGEACHDAQAHRHALIGERDDEAAELHPEVVDLRTVLRARSEAEPARRLIGLRGDTSRDPVALRRQADRAVRRLRDTGRPLPDSRVPTGDTERLRWATPVARAAGALRATLGRVAEAVKELDAARLERRCALKSFNQGFVRIAGLFEALYRAIGRDDLATIVRPSKQYPGLTFRQGKRAAKKAGARSESEPRARRRLRRSSTTAERSARRLRQGSTTAEKSARNLRRRGAAAEKSSRNLRRDFTASISSIFRHTRRSPRSNRLSTAARGVPRARIDC